MLLALWPAHYESATAPTKDTNACYLELEQSGSVILEAGDGFLLLNNCPVEENVGGWVFDNHSQYYKVIEQQEKAALELKEKEERIIRLQQEAQELRLQQIALEKAKEKQSKRQLSALEAEIQRILDLIAQEIRYREILERKLFDLRNDEAMLVLSMAMPFHTIGRSFYMH